MPHTFIIATSNPPNGILPEASEFTGSSGAGPLAVTVSLGAVVVIACDQWAPNWGPPPGLHSELLDVFWFALYSFFLFGMYSCVHN